MTFQNPVLCPRIMFVRCVWITDQTAIISLHRVKWLVFNNLDGECLLRGPIWTLKYKLRIVPVFKELMFNFKEMRLTVWIVVLGYRRTDRTTGMITHGVHLLRTPEMQLCCQTHFKFNVEKTFNQVSSYSILYLDHHHLYRRNIKTTFRRRNLPPFLDKRVRKVLLWTSWWGSED
jgi:hypothetical protein